METNNSLFFQSCWLDPSVWILSLRMKNQHKSQKEVGAVVMRKHCCIMIQAVQHLFWLKAPKELNFSAFSWFVFKWL